MDDGQAQGRNCSLWEVFALGGSVSDSEMTFSLPIDLGIGSTFVG
jgi:hypothetical protein